MPRIYGTPIKGGGFSPRVPVQLVVGGNRIWGRALIDSGADMTIFPAEIASLAGVDFSNLPPQAKKSQGAGGSFETRPCRGKVLWRSWTVAQLFLVAEPECGLALPLLGRADFFKRFAVTFDWTAVPTPWFEIDTSPKPEQMQAPVMSESPGQVTLPSPPARTGKKPTGKKRKKRR